MVGLIIIGIFTIIVYTFRENLKKRDPDNTTFEIMSNDMLLYSGIGLIIIGVIFLLVESGVLPS